LYALSFVLIATDDSAPWVRYKAIAPDTSISLKEDKLRVSALASLV
jgi:hypothetical protein